jgi:hypothetical protein
MTAGIRASHTGVPLSRSASADSTMSRQSAPLSAPTPRPGTGIRAPSSRLKKRAVQNNLRLPKMAETLKEEEQSGEAPESPEKLVAPPTISVKVERHAPDEMQQQQQPNMTLALGFGKTEPRPISPGLQKLLLSMDPPSPLLSKKEKHALACQYVSDQAFRRTLYNVEKGAFEELEEERRNAEREQKLENLEKLRREKLANDINDLKQTLQTQIDYQERVRSIPAVASLTSLKIEDSGVAEREENKHDLLLYLNRQINEKRRKNESEKTKKLIEESRFLDHVAMEFDLQNVEERAAHLEKQRALLDDWERAAHINNLKKLKGLDVVQTYVTKNFESTTAQSPRPPTEGAQLSGRGLGMSIGFDSRRTSR